MVNITPIINATLALIAALITCFLIPWIKTKLSAENYDKMLKIARIAVMAAEQMFDANECAGKKEFVVRYLGEQGYAIDDTLNNAIEAMVLDIHKAIE